MSRAECEHTATCSYAEGRCAPLDKVCKAATKHCFVCQYLEFPGCTKATSELDCKNFTPEGGLKGDCNYADGTCVSRFKEACQTTFQKYLYDYLGLPVFSNRPRDFRDLPKGTPLSNKSWESQGEIQEYLLTDSGSVWKVDLAECKTVKYVYIGHQNESKCEGYFKNVQGCIKQAPSCRDFTAINEGCQTFANTDRALEAANRLRRTLPAGTTLTVSANQALASNTCNTKMTMKISCDTVRTTYQECHNSTDFCFGEYIAEHNLPPDVVKCTAAGGVQKEICCPNNHWYHGEECPKLSSTTGICDNIAKNYSCRNAEKNAKIATNGCLRNEQASCNDHQGDFEWHDCSRYSVEQGGLLSDCVSGYKCHFSCNAHT